MHLQNVYLQYSNVLQWTTLSIKSYCINACGSIQNGLEINTFSPCHFGLQHSKCIYSTYIFYSNVLPFMQFCNKQIIMNYECLWINFPPPLIAFSFLSVVVPVLKSHTVQDRNALDWQILGLIMSHHCPVPPTWAAACSSVIFAVVMWIKQACL